MPRSAGDSLIEPAARFAADWARVTGASPGGDDRIALGVSGGSDSMAMLVLAHAAFPGQVVAATVDHALRPGSADEAVMVGRYCADHAIPHATLMPNVPIAGASLQAQAREARYALLTRWAAAEGASALATAHHADDQAETFLMRAARGSGLSGLAGVRASQIRDGVILVRPLLDWRRAALRAIVRQSGTPFVDDPANADDRHDRTRFRRLLEANEWLDPPRIARAAGHLAEAEAAIDALLGWHWETRRKPLAEGAVAIDMADLPREIVRRLARRAIGEVRTIRGIDRPDWSDAVAIEPLLDALEAQKSATQAGVMISRNGALWHFREAPPRRSH